MRPQAHVELDRLALRSALLKLHACGPQQRNQPLRSAPHGQPRWGRRSSLWRQSTPPRIVLSSSLKRERPDDQRVSPLRHALREYRWLKTRQGQITGKPDKNDRDDHAVDALRYAVVCAGRRHREWVDGEAQPRAWTRNADRATVRYG